MFLKELPLYLQKKLKRTLEMSLEAMNSYYGDRLLLQKATSLDYQYTEWSFLQIASVWIGEKESMSQWSIEFVVSPISAGVGCSVFTPRSVSMIPSSEIEISNQTGQLNKRI